MGTTRDWLLFFHVVAVVVAFAPMTAHAVLQTTAAREGPEALRKAAGYMARNDQRIYGPALVVVGLFGIALVESEAYWSFSDSWIASALVLWMILLGVLFGFMIPAERRLAEGDMAAEKLVKIGGAALILLFLSMVHLMVFKPGL